MGFHLSDDDTVKLCREIDNIEADMRSLENRLTRIRMRLRQSVSERRHAECGFYAATDDGKLTPKIANA